jgi:hypothetical protein
MSTPSMAMTMTMDIGIEISQNNLHSLIALFFSTAFRSILKYFNHLRRKMERIPTIFSFCAQTVDLPDRSR